MTNDQKLIISRFAKVSRIITTMHESMTTTRP